MSIQGLLSDFSLTEIFQFIEQGHKTGLLTLRSLPDSRSPSPSAHYIWVSKGGVVAAANQLNDRGLILLIEQYPWVSDRVVDKLAQFCPSHRPFGLYLKKQGVLQTEQLEHLFQIQLVQELCAVFQLEDARFQFDLNVPMPTREMTGLSLRVSLAKVMWHQMMWLEKLFEARNRESNEFSNQTEKFCDRLRLILDIAFFHSLNFSLLNAKNSYNKFYQILELCDRPYDLPKSLSDRAMCCTGK